MQMSLVHLKLAAAERCHTRRCTLGNTRPIHDSVSKKARHILFELTTVSLRAQDLLKHRTRVSPGCRMNEEGFEPHGAGNILYDCSPIAGAQLLKHIVQPRRGSTRQGRCIARAPRVEAGTEIARCRAGKSNELPRRKPLCVYIVQSVPSRSHAFKEDNATTRQEDVRFDRASVAHPLSIDDTRQILVCERLRGAGHGDICRSITINRSNCEHVDGFSRRK